MDELKALFSYLPKDLVGRVALGLVGLFALVYVVGIVRAAFGQQVDIFGIHFGAKTDHSACDRRANELRTSIEALGADSQAKRNAIRAMRELTHELCPLLKHRDECTDTTVHQFINNTLVRILAIISTGAHDHHRASVWVRDGLMNYRMHEAVGFRREAVTDARLDGTSIIGRVYVRNEMYNCPDVSDDANFQEKKRTSGEYKSLLCVPIRTADGQVSGVLAIDAEAKGYFDNNHVFLVTAFAEMLGMILR